MRVTVEELMDRLSEMPPEAEVRLAHQPSWPFEYSVDGWNPVVAVESGGDDGEGPRAGSGQGETVVYLVEGTQLGYLPGDAAEACGWSA